MSADNSTFHWHSENWHRDRARKGGGKWEEEREKRMGEEMKSMTGWEGKGWSWWAAGHWEKKATLGNNEEEDDIDLKECVCVSVCVSLSRDCPSFIYCNCVHEWKACLCVSVRVCRVHEWQETATQSISESRRELETQRKDRCPTAHTHTGPLPCWPFLNVTGHLAHWRGV